MFVSPLISRFAWKRMVRVAFYAKSWLQVNSLFRVAGEVSTSGSDRVSIQAMVEIAETITRSLPLPVLTPSILDGNGERGHLGTIANARTGNVPNPFTF